MRCLSSTMILASADSPLSTTLVRIFPKTLIRSQFGRQRSQKKSYLKTSLKKRSRKERKRRQRRRRRRLKKSQPSPSARATRCTSTVRISSNRPQCNCCATLKMVLKNCLSRLSTRTLACLHSRSRTWVRKSLSASTRSLLNSLSMDNLSHPMG